MDLAIAASNIDQYKTWGELPDDLKNLITKKIVSSRSPPSTLPSKVHARVLYLFKNQGRTVCLLCSQAETESMEEVLD